MKGLRPLLIGLATAVAVAVAGAVAGSAVADPAQGQTLIPTVPLPTDAATPTSASTVSPMTTATPSLLMSACNRAKVTPACETEALAEYDLARAKEGLGPMTLPSNFLQLTVPEQLLVVADVDRVDRGLRPVVGLSKALQRYAQKGANKGGDPPFPPWTRSGGSNWASGGNALLDEFLWMYDDGPGLNLDCLVPGASGCWGHRKNILRRYPGPLLMGAGHGSHGDTQLFLGADRHDRPNLFRWSQEKRYLTSSATPLVAGGLLLPFMHA